MMMFELACLLLALVWLYFWLSGHWFARALGFLALLGAAGVAGFIAFMALPSKPGPWDVASVEPAPTKPDGPWKPARVVTDDKGTYLTLDGGEWKSLPPGFVFNKPKLSGDVAPAPETGNPFEKYVNDPPSGVTSRWPGTKLRSLSDGNDPKPFPAPASRWREYGGLALAGLLALLSWPLASIPIAYHRRAWTRRGLTPPATPP